MELFFRLPRFVFPRFAGHFGVFKIFFAWPERNSCIFIFIVWPFLLLLLQLLKLLFLQLFFSRFPFFELFPGLMQYIFAFPLLITLFTSKWIRVTFSSKHLVAKIFFIFFLGRGQISLSLISAFSQQALMGDQIFANTSSLERHSNGNRGVVDIQHNFLPCS